MTDEEIVRGLFWSPGGRPAPMWYRVGTNDWNTLSSCMTEDEYGMRGMDDVDTLVDVGGYLGGLGIGWALDHRGSRVWIVEPLPANVELIERNVAENEVGDRVTVVPRAVGRPGQTQTTIRWGFGDDENGRHHRYVGNSTLSRHSKQHQKATVRTVDLPALVAMAGGHIDVLKVDCEGAEYDLFADGAEGVGRIVGEFHSGRQRLVDLLVREHAVHTTGTDHFGAFTAVPYRAEVAA